MTAQGNALGFFGRFSQALKGRNYEKTQGVMAISPRWGFAIKSIAAKPRALPWASILRPDGA